MMNANHAIALATVSSVSPWRNDAWARDGNARKAKTIKRTNPPRRSRRELSKDWTGEFCSFTMYQSAFLSFVHLLCPEMPRRQRTLQFVMVCTHPASVLMPEPTNLLDGASLQLDFRRTSSRKLTLRCDIGRTLLAQQLLFRESYTARLSMLFLRYSRVYLSGPGTRRSWTVMPRFSNSSRKRGEICPERPTKTCPL